MDGEAAYSLLRTVHNEVEGHPALAAYRHAAVQSTCSAARAAVNAGGRGISHVGPLLMMAHNRSRNNAPDTLPDVLRTMISLTLAVASRHRINVFDEMFLDDAAKQEPTLFKAAITAYVGVTKLFARSAAMPEDMRKKLGQRVKLAVKTATDFAHAHPEDTAHLVPRTLAASLKLARDLRDHQQTWGGPPRHILEATYGAVDRDSRHFRSHLAAFGNAARHVAMHQTQYHPRTVPAFLAEVVGVCSTDPLSDPRDGFVSASFVLTAAYDDKRAAVVFPAHRRQPPVVFNGDVRIPADQLHLIFNDLGSRLLLIPATDWCQKIAAQAKTPDGLPSFLHAINERRASSLIPF